jgi:DNA-binding IclR family transcriptional regulator
MSELELEKAAAERDFALRTLRVIAEPLSYRVLECCVAKECSTDDLVGELHLPGVAVWERVNDLIQVGLVQRDLDRAKVSVTPAGLALHGIVESVVALATEQGPMLDRGLTS